MGNAMKIILSGEMIKSDEALRIGLVDEVVEPEALREHVLALAEIIGSKSAATLRIAKEALRASERMPIEEGIVYERDLFCMCFSFEDKKEGVDAFLNKREAKFTHR